MQLTDAVFIFLFLPLVLFVYYIPFVYKRAELKNLWLFFVSLGFYAWESLSCTVLLLLSITVNYVLGGLLERVRVQQNKEDGNHKIIGGRQLVALACVYNIGILVCFKYLGSAVTGIAGLIGMESLSVFSNIALPLGISFYTFKALSYIIDVYRGKEKAQKNFVDLGLFLSFFACVISGPITKYHDVAAQLEDRKSSVSLFADGVKRFTIGLAKSLLLGSKLSALSTYAFSMEGSELSVLFAWGGAFAYMLYIYFDFSGYSDMAIGLGKMFGFQFRENFNYPYLSTSVSEYWRRWHISLGEWFQEYLYYPISLGPALKIRKAVGKRVNRRQAAVLSSGFTLLIVWFCTGIWHGANMTFVVWGLLNFVFVWIDSIRKPNSGTRLATAGAWAATFLIILFTKVIFRADSMGAALRYVASMFHLNGNTFTDKMGSYWLLAYLFYLVVGTVFAFPVVELLKDKIVKIVPKASAAWEVIQFLLIVALLLLSVSFAVGGTYNPPAYANF